MARGKSIDMGVLLAYAERHAQASSRQERGDVLREFSQLTGLSPATVYQKLKHLKRGHSPVSLAAGRVARKSRKSDAALAMEREHALSVAGLSQGHYGSTELRIMVAENMGLLPKGFYSTPAGLVRMNRILRREGLNQKASTRRSAAYHITANHPGHVFVVDATPMNHYYLRLDGRVVPYDLPRGDTHASDLLLREGLFKIWVYYLVDMHSKTFLVRAFAPLPTSKSATKGGENSTDWLAFLKWAFLPKRGTQSPLEGRLPPLHDCPLEGVPDILYADRGSGIGNSSLINRFVNRLGSRVETHLPGNPSAKGLVESRIGAVKRGPESILARHTIQNINQLNYFYQAWAAHICRKRGFYSRWQAGVKDHPIRRITEQNVYDALVANVKRVVNRFGQISIDGTEFYVTHEDAVIGQKIAIYMPAVRQGEERRYVAELPDGRIVPLVDPREREHGFEDIKSNPQSQGAINRDEARIRGKRLAKMVLFEDTLPPENQAKVLRFPNPAQAVETSSLAPPESFATLESALLWVHRLTRLDDAEINALDPENPPLETLRTVFANELKITGSIKSAHLVYFCNMIVEKYKEKTNEATAH
ncbi:MAG: DDE-type integrase/transposase/recombinase [Spirochaetales bacterium]|nr:DDE-type integrase/transposase/recombinase [Spirochaetales bacterium]